MEPDMKRLLLTAAIVASGAASASAADLGAPYVKAPATVYNWTGFYIGGNIGGGMASSHFDDPCFYCSSATPTSGFFTGGAQVGYNYQLGAGLVGIEADVNGNSGFKDSVLGGQLPSALSIAAKADVSGSIRARAGLVVGNVMAYVTGGAAWADVKQTGIDRFNFVDLPRAGEPTGTTANRSGILWGSVIGAGVEFAMGSNWSVGGEFLHTMYQDRDTNLVVPDGGSACGISHPVNTCVIRHQLTTDVARLRINYKFAP
jgi:opacity protein-like surface antigen